MLNVDVQNIHYLAFEGGGGKAIVYLGALRVLEEAGLLPYDSTVATPQLCGVAGASGGAITAFIIALGLNADEIADNTSAGFDDFFDPPERGFYKAVMYDKETKTNRSGYSIAHPKPWPGEKAYDINDTERSFFHEDLERARFHGLQIAGLKQKKFNKLMTLAPIVAEVLVPDDSILAKKILGGSKAQKVKYIYSALFDRGVFAGIRAHQYFTTLLQTWAHLTYGTLLSEDEARNYTFRQFFELTGSFDFRLICTNITSQKPKVFSRKHTPDFPVVDAVCMSMAIPGVFRPTFVDAFVNLEQMNGTAEEIAELQDYMGFYVDGGTTNNFPIHAFDGVDDADANLLNPSVLGIRCTGGPDRTFLVDYRTKDDLYKEYSALKPRDEGRPIPEKITFASDHTLIYTCKAHKGISTLFDLGGSLYESVMYNTEEGQIRTNAEREHVIELFSYDVGLFDFDLSSRPELPWLSLFVQRTAAVKLARELRIFGKDEDTYAKMIRSRVASLEEATTLKQRVATMLYQRYDANTQEPALRKAVGQ
jgi:predicted acylesterase/phospholipase RssA